MGWRYKALGQAGMVLHEQKKFSSDANQGEDDGWRAEPGDEHGGDDSRKNIHSAVHLLSKAIKLDKTVGLLMMRARLHIKLKSLHAAYTDASEALRLEPKNAAAIRLKVKISNVLNPLKRRIELAAGLIAEAEETRNFTNQKEAIHLLDRAKAVGVRKLEGEILWKRSIREKEISRFDMLYIDCSEILMRDSSFNIVVLVWFFDSAVNLPGYKRGPSAYDRSQANMSSQHATYISEMKATPVPYKRSNWPCGLKLAKVEMPCNFPTVTVRLEDGRALTPRVRLIDLPRFLNNHAAIVGSYSMAMTVVDERYFEMLRQIRPDLLTVEALSFGAVDFRQLSRASFEQLFGGGMLRSFICNIMMPLMMPRGMDLNELFRMPAIREVNKLVLESSEGVALERQKIRTEVAIRHVNIGHRRLGVDSALLQDGHAKFIDALIKDFKADKEKRFYTVTIRCYSTSKITRREVQRYVNPHNGDQLIIEERVMPAGCVQTHDYLMIQAGRCGSGGMVDFKWEHA